MTIRGHSFQLIYAGFIVVEWLLFTLGLASAMIRSATPFELYVSPRLPYGGLLVVTFLLAFLLALSVGSLKASLPLTTAMVIGAGMIFGVVLYSPAWLGTLLRSEVFADYAQRQALLITVLTAPAAFVGAIVGHFFSDDVPQRIETWSRNTDERPVSWWETPDRRTREQTGDDGRS